MKIVKPALVVIVFVFMFFSTNIAACEELEDGSIVPATGVNIGVKAGEIAPDLTLGDLNGNLKSISFKGTPTLMISLYTLNGDVNKIKQLVDSYANRKDVKLLFVVRDEVEYVKVFLMKNNLDIPVYFERK